MMPSVPTDLQSVSAADSPAESAADRWCSRLNQPVSCSGLVVIRMALGLAVAWFAFKHLSSQSLDYDYIAPPLHFTYRGFGWVRPWPGQGMYFHFLALFLAALGVAAGLFYRVCSVVLFLTFTHVFLLEQALYNNHYYLICLLGCLFMFLPLHRAGSLDALRLRGLSHPPAATWMVWLLRLQIGVVYFYGGIAKLNSDWLQGQPLRSWLAAQPDHFLLGPWVTEEWMVQLFVWGGILIDLAAVPLLSMQRARGPVFCALMIFHLINSTLFNIGVFPWLMMALTTIYFPPNWPRSLLQMPTARTRRVMPTTAPRMSRGLLAALAVWTAIQLLLPLRHHLYAGDASWNELGHKFAWRMMLREKLTAVRFHGTNPETGHSGEIDIRPFLTPRQAANMCRNPDMLLQFCHWLHAELMRLGMGPTEIRATLLVSLNGRKPQLMVDPTVDLAAEPVRLTGYPWVLPLTEPLRQHAWDVPVSQWESSLATESTSSGPVADRN